MTKLIFNRRFINLKIGTIPKTNNLMILSIDAESSSQNPKFINKFEIFDLSKIESNSNKKSSVVLSKENVSSCYRDSVIYFESDCPFIHFSVSNNKKLSILRKDGKLILTEGLCNKFEKINFKDDSTTPGWY